MIDSMMIDNREESPEEQLDSLDDQFQPLPIESLPQTYAQQSFASMVNRNYRRYVLRSLKTNDDEETGATTSATVDSLVYLRHPSGVIVVILGDNHPALSTHIDKVDFNSQKKGRGRRILFVVLMLLMV